MRPGDLVWIPPGEKHRHGATAITAMTHIAIQEKLNGNVVEWLEVRFYARENSAWVLRPLRINIDLRKRGLADRNAFPYRRV